MHFGDKVVLVTGGTGSFGRKFVATILKTSRPRKLIVFSRDEMKQHEMRKEFPDAGDSPMRYFIGDVRDAERLRRAMSGVDVVVHAAALKQVPSCEYNPFEAVKTNVLGAQNVIDAAIDCNVTKVLAISTDKAVSPVNIYGATKLCAEKLFVHGNSYSREGGARFACCRYGNVVGSRGSVIPVFQEQRKNGLITLTDERMTRFWLTLTQGVEFVIRCIGLMRGGEVFVPKIPSMRVADLARVIAPDTPVEIIGVRPGEKIHEALLSEDEARDAVELDDMYVVGRPDAPAGPRYLAQGRRLPPGFRYTSDTNTRWLTTDELQALVDEE
jgi:UDP-N-acetylglucosamine 4,6-dehydratase/5-epimerase